MRALVLLAAGCNPVFGLDKTDLMTPIDAQYFDAPADAAPLCPAPGDEPKFQMGYLQVPIFNCESYLLAPDAKIAVAYCDDLGGIVEGPIDGTLAPVTLTPAPTEPLHMRFPRVSPDGETMWVDHPPTLKMILYRRTGPGAWERTAAELDDGLFREISNPTRGPNRRAIQTDYDGAMHNMIELAEQPDGSWIAIDQYPVTQIGAGYIERPALSGDGLRMTFSGPAAGDSPSAPHLTRFTQRPDLSSRFGPAVLLTTAPNQRVDSPTLTDDCGRLYYGGLGTHFYQKAL